MLQSLVSIHDVMPSTMDEVDELLSKCEKFGVSTVTLLVVPGLEWSREQLDRLWGWEDRGVEFAGHGWSHRCKQIRGLRHRMHSLFLSRNVAEHLELTAVEIKKLLNRCAEWFSSVWATNSTAVCSSGLGDGKPERNANGRDTVSTFRSAPRSLRSF